MSENLRKIKEHRRSTSESNSDQKTNEELNSEKDDKVSMFDNIETVKELFEEQLDFLDKEKLVFDRKLSD